MADLVETMRFDPVDGIYLLERHLARMKAAAAALGLAFDRHAARNALQAATFRLDVPACVRLLAAPGGAIAIESRALPPPPATPVAVTLVTRDEGAARGARTLGEGTADRAAAGTFEVLYATPSGHLTEGSLTTPFVADGAVLLTPPLLVDPALAGVLRAELLATGRARERVLRVADLAGGFLVGNALLGLLPARFA